MPVIATCWRSDFFCMAAMTPTASTLPAEEPSMASETVTSTSKPRGSCPEYNTDTALAIAAAASHEAPVSDEPAASTVTA